MVWYICVKKFRRKNDARDEFCYSCLLFKKPLCNPIPGAVDRKKAFFHTTYTNIPLSRAILSPFLGSRTTLRQHLIPMLPGVYLFMFSFPIQKLLLYKNNSLWTFQISYQKKLMPFNARINWCLLFSLSCSSSKLISDMCSFSRGLSISWTPSIPPLRALESTIRELLEVQYSLCFHLQEINT